MKARKAGENDIPLCVSLGKRFYDESGFSEFVPFDYGTATLLAANLIQSPNGAMFLIDDIGVVGGIITPFVYNSSVPVAQELFWWVDPPHRGRGGILLYKALKEWAEENGAKIFNMIELNKIPGAGAFYEKNGFVPLETIYIKKLEK